MDVIIPLLAFVVVVGFMVQRVRQDTWIRLCVRTLGLLGIGYSLGYVTFGLPGWLLLDLVYGPDVVASFAPYTVGTAALLITTLWPVGIVGCPLLLGRLRSATSRARQVGSCIAWLLGWSVMLTWIIGAWFGMR
jgi:hypothetical protein